MEIINLKMGANCLFFTYKLCFLKINNYKTQYLKILFFSHVNTLFERAALVGDNPEQYNASEMRVMKIGEHLKSPR